MRYHHCIFCSDFDLYFYAFQGMTHLSEEDNVLLSSICQTISNLSVDQVEDPDHVFDFRGLRLDWTRLQVRTINAWTCLTQYRGLARGLQISPTVPFGPPW